MIRYALSPDAVCAVVDDGAVVLHMRTRRYYSLNETGTTIWGSLDSGKPVTDIVASLVADYEIDATTAEAEVARILAELASVELVTIEAP